MTFVVPGRNRSGGVRVTVAMANGLLERGYAARIAHRRERPGALARLARGLRSFPRRRHGSGERDWLESFRGVIAPYDSLDELDYSEGEVVIAVGSLTVLDVAGLRAPVSKLRYCHGFSRNRPDLMGAPWEVPMDTIAVAPGLVPEIEERTGAAPLAVVPNAVCPDEYHPEPGVERAGVGAVYYEHHSKAPEVMLELLARIRARWPGLPQQVFGMAPRPRGLAPESYTRAPSIDEARRLYSASRVWLVTSRYEGFGLPLLEAMACGTPVVSTAHDGCEGLLVSGENGFAVPFGEWDAYLDRVGDLLEDEAAWQRASARALETARGFSWERSVEGMDRFLQRHAQCGAGAQRGAGG